MTEILPPLRTTHLFSAPGGQWGYDLWGRHGRPVVFLPAVLFDRTSWWPTAADLRPYATVVAVDLPGHGSSQRRDHYEPDELADDLAALIAGLRLRRAPVVVGHGPSAALATLFAARYATRAVVAVDPIPLDALSAGVTAYLNTWDIGAVPQRYRDLVQASRDPRLLSAYATCLHHRGAATATPGAIVARLAVHSPAPEPCRADERADEGWRHEHYDVPGRFAHLTATARFVTHLRTLL